MEGWSLIIREESTAGFLTEKVMLFNLHQLWLIIVISLVGPICRKLEAYVDWNLIGVVMIFVPDCT